MNAATLLVRAAQQTPDAPALAEHTTVVATYSGLRDRVEHLASGLAARGIGPGSRVAIFAGNRADMIEAMLAILWSGAAMVPINAKLARPELDVILDRATPSLLLTGSDTAETADGVPQVVLGSADHAALYADTSALPVPMARDRDDLAWLFFTSGTTGVPKGAMITHGNLFAVVQGYLTDVDRPPLGGALIHFAPLSHGSGIYLFPFLAQSSVNVVGAAPRMTPDMLFDVIAHWPHSSLFAAPTIVQRMTHAAQTRTPATRNLRTVVYGGGPLYFEDLIAAADTFGPKFAQIYGQGESPMTITAQSRELFSRALADRDDTYLKTVGRPFAGLDVDVVDTDGVSCSVGAVGEIVVAGPTVCNGYWQDEAATAASFRGGRLWTGDLGQKDARGCITLAGRSKETIITGGSNVYPIEVETVLMTHASVEEAAVTGIADPAWGEAVVAFVRLSAAAGSDADAISAELDDHCRANIARFKCPKRYVVCDALPTNAYGKIDKRKLVAGL